MCFIECVLLQMSFEWVNVLWRHLVKNHLAFFLSLRDDGSLYTRTNAKKHILQTNKQDVIEPIVCDQ